jgi:hypothetical protein
VLIYKAVLSGYRMDSQRRGGGAEVPSARRPRTSGTIVSRELKAIPLPMTSIERNATTCDMLLHTETSVEDQQRVSSSLTEMFLQWQSLTKLDMNNCASYQHPVHDSQQTHIMNELIACACCGCQ